MSSRPEAQDRLRRAWQDGRAAVGAWVSTRLDPVALEAVGKLGYDYVCIDLQHGAMDAADVLGMLQALALGDATPLVRVPGNEAAVIGRVLDAGAIGVIVPMVNTPDEAARAVAACRYAPAGARSFGPVRASVAYGADYQVQANARVVCIPMIETAQAVHNVGAIAAVAGVDALYVGPYDLSLTLGLPPAADGDGALADALGCVVKAALACGVVPGVHASVELLGKRVAAGFRMVTVAGDMAVIVGGFAEALRQARLGGSSQVSNGEKGK